jgi:hypothetical protein
MDAGEQGGAEATGEGGAAGASIVGSAGTDMAAGGSDGGNMGSAGADTAGAGGTDGEDMGSAGKMAAGGTDSGDMGSAGADTAGAGGTDAGDCLGDAADEASCAALPTTECDGAAEGFSNPVYDTCVSAGSLRPGVFAEVVACLSAVEADVCDADAETSATECLDDAKARACASSTAEAECKTIVGLCTDLTQEDCVQELTPYPAGTQQWASGCMDPAGEGYDAAFEGTCAERLDACIG